jgi:hypothetical protein
MTFRTLDSAPLNEICMHPEVRPWLGFPETEALKPIDLSLTVGNPNNFTFLTNHQDGAYVLVKLQQGLYAAHSLAKPSARGRPMLRLMREGFSTMFLSTDAIEIITQIPDGNDNAKGWSELAGFRPTFRREAFFPLMGETVGCQFLSLTYGDWVTKDRENLRMGRLFHERLDAQGVKVDHPDDAVHDSWVGATICAAIRGNVSKGVALYNRYAVIAGYQPASLISVTPPVVDTGNAVVSIEDGKLDVLSAVAQSAPQVQIGEPECRSAPGLPQ